MNIQRKAERQQKQKFNKVNKRMVIFHIPTVNRIWVMLLVMAGVAVMGVGFYYLTN